MSGSGFNLRGLPDPKEVDFGSAEPSPVHSSPARKPSRRRKVSTDGEVADGFEASKPSRRRKVSTDGEVADGFEAVKQEFIENFTRRSEREGAALAVYHKGALVADLWGGFADRKTGSQWHRDTLASIFCCTKSVAAICVAMKVDQGECSYSDKVVKFWPEFKHNNKQDITIEMILTHRIH